MAFGRLSPHKPARLMSDINVTPLVDVMLVLLVIFILAAPVMASRLALDLPRADVPDAPAPPHTVRLSRSLGSGWLWDGEAIGPAELARRLTELAQRQPDTELQLLADQRLPYGEVLALMAQAQAAGLARVGFVAQPASAVSKP
jgi:biopolymer transport protein TolR